MGRGRKIALFTLGTRGDVEPFLALALTLAGRGHAVTLAGPDDAAPAVAAAVAQAREAGALPRGADVAFAPMGTDFAALIDTPDARRAVQGNALAALRLWRRHTGPMVAAALRTLWTVGQGADILIHHPKVVGAADVAEATGAAVVCASPVPMVPTAAMPFIGIGRDLGPLNRASWSALRLARRAYGRWLNPWRRESLALDRPFRRRPGTDPVYGADLRLIGVSPHVVPRPDDWDPDTHLTGYWRLPTVEPAPDAAVAAALRPPPPVHVGFGSMPVSDPALRDTVTAAAEQAGVRVVMGGLPAGGAGPVAALPPLPHDWLFPRVAAVVHHGGAGTTAAVLIAGRPSLVCPVGVDQPFWARRVAALGCGPPPLPFRRLTAPRLAARLADLTSGRYDAAAGALGARLRAEDGCARAADAIEALLARGGATG
ncbi:glycosyltransferase [Rhodobacteraceae bacterium CCMM004]|nr:glycosyltransferase [Rhodobacteraceae bacterium CCMM004]